MNFVHVCIKDGVVSSMSGVEESHVTCLMLSRDLNNVVFGTAEGWVKIYNCPKNDVRNLVRHEDPVTSVVISDFLPYVVSGSVDKAVNITNIDTCVTITCLGHEDTVREADLYRKVKHNISHRIVLIKNLAALTFGAYLSLLLGKPKHKPLSLPLYIKYVKFFTYSIYILGSQRCEAYTKRRKSSLMFINWKT